MAGDLSKQSLDFQDYLVNRVMYSGFVSLPEEKGKLLRFASNDLIRKPKPALNELERRFLTFIMNSADPNANPLHIAGVMSLLGLFSPTPSRKTPPPSVEQIPALKRLRRENQDSESEALRRRLFEDSGDEAPTIMTVDAEEKKEDEPVLDVGDVSPENKKEEGIEDNQKVGLVTQKREDSDVDKENTPPESSFFSASIANSCSPVNATHSEFYLGEHEFVGQSSVGYKRCNLRSKKSQKMSTTGYFIRHQRNGGDHLQMLADPISVCQGLSVAHALKEELVSVQAMLQAKTDADFELICSRMTVPVTPAFVRGILQGRLASNEDVILKKTA